MFNFGAVQDKISGPVAIVNVGAEVARTDIAGLYQFAALVNLNLAVGLNRCANLLTSECQC